MEFFEKRVRPLFASKCYACHGEKVQMGGLELSSAAGLAHAFESGSRSPRATPRRAACTERYLYSEAVKMPPAGKLAAEEIAARTNLDRERGARYPKPPSAATPVRRRPSHAEDRKHWAFQPIQDATAANPRRDVVANPIDSFILAKLEEKGIQPAPARRRN